MFSQEILRDASRLTEPERFDADQEPGPTFYIDAEPDSAPDPNFTLLVKNCSTPIFFLFHFL